MRIKLIIIILFSDETKKIGIFKANLVKRTSISNEFGSLADEMDEHSSELYLLSLSLFIIIIIFSY